MEDKSNPVPNPTEQGSTQLQDTIRVTIQALEEFNSPSVHLSETRGLKEGWIDHLKERLTENLGRTEGRTDSITVPTYTDASFALQPDRGFFTGFMVNFGSPLRYENINDYVLQKGVGSITEDKIEEPREVVVVRITDSSGKLKYLATKTKIDGLQILLDGSAITDPNKTDRTVKPILVISNKS